LASVTEHFDDRLDMQVLNYQYSLIYYRAKARLLQIKTLLATTTRILRSYAARGNICVVLRFDDATQDQYEYAFPLLESFNLKDVISVPTGYVGKNSVLEGDRVLKPIDSWTKLREMLSAGWDVIPHGRFHLMKGPYMFIADKALEDEITYPIVEFIKNIDIRPQTFVPPGLTTHQNPLGKRELKLLTRFYDTVILSSGYNHPSPILNRTYRGILWSIPSTDSDKWVQMFTKFLKRLKSSGNHGIIIIFFHEIYLQKNKRTSYGFWYERLKVLLNDLCKLGINICNLSEAVNGMRLLKES
jgi:hypothetical protein